LRQPAFEPEPEKKRMPGRWGYDDGGDVGRKDKGRIEWPVEDEPEMVLGMLCRDPFQRFKSKPTDSFKFIFDQQTGIDSNVHQASKI